MEDPGSHLGRVDIYLLSLVFVFHTVPLNSTCSIFFFTCTFLFA